MAGDTTGTGEPMTESFSLFKIITEGGPLGIVIVVALFILLAFAVYIFVERYLTIKQAAEVDENFMYNIRNNVQRGNIEAALQLCQTTDSPVARMVEKGLKRIGKPLRDINTAIENVGNLEIIKLEKKSLNTSFYFRCCTNDWFLRYCNRYDYGIFSKWQPKPM